MDGHHHVCGLSRPEMKMVRVLGGEGRVVWMKVQLRRTDELEFSCMKRGSILELDRVDVRKRYEEEWSIYYTVEVGEVVPRYAAMLTLIQGVCASTKSEIVDCCLDRLANGLSPMPVPD